MFKKPSSACTLEYLGLAARGFQGGLGGIAEAVGLHMQALGELALAQYFDVLILAADEAGLQHVLGSHRAGETLVQRADVDDLDGREMGIESALGNAALKRVLSAFETGA